MKKMKIGLALLLALCVVGIRASAQNTPNAWYLTGAGQASQVNTTSWCLGYNPNFVATLPGTCELTWTSNNQVQIPVGTSLVNATVGGRFYTLSVSSFTPASALQIQLATTTIAANTFTRAGQSIYVVASGSMTAGAYQTVALQVNGTVVSSATLAVGTGGANWTLKAEIYEVSPNTHVVVDAYAVIGSSVFPSALGPVPFNSNLVFTDTLAFTVSVVGNGTGTAGTVTQYAEYIEKREQ